MPTISASDLTFSSPQSDLFPKCPYSASSTIYLRPSRGQHFIVFLAIVYHLGPSFHTRVLFLTAERAHSLWIIPSSLPESCLPEARAISGDSSDLMMYRCRLSHPGTPSGTSLRNLSRTFSCCYCFIVHPQNSRFRNYITRTRVLRDRNCKRWLMRLYKSKLSSSLLLSLTGISFACHCATTQLSSNAALIVDFTSIMVINLCSLSIIQSVYFLIATQNGSIPYDCLRTGFKHISIQFITVFLKCWSQWNST